MLSQVNRQTNSHGEVRSSFLIVNADDFGYFESVSLGIIDAHKHGIVTATGVMANSERFFDDIGLLTSQTNLDIGVHLNLTHGNALSRNGVCFSGIKNLAFALLRNRFTHQKIEIEWRAQIERCLDQGLTISFLNSHEHVHMLPSLFTLTQKLARQYQIPYIRLPAAKFAEHRKFFSLIRASVTNICLATNRRRLNSRAPRFVGMAESGRLTEDYVVSLFHRMTPGATYELMCHPGRLAKADNIDPAILRYHAWEQELEVLTSNRIKSALDANNVKLVNYSSVQTSYSDTARSVTPK